MLKEIRCIRIVHPAEKIKLYRMLSGFFRLMGIFVCENIKDRESSDPKDWSYEVPFDSEEVKGDRKDPEASLKEEFAKAWNEIAERLGDGIRQVFAKVAEIYLENDLMRKSYAVAYFADTGDEYIYERMTDSRDYFEKALTELEDFERCREADAPGNIYIWAAKANCKRRICELHMIVWNAIISEKYGQSEEEREERKQQLWEKRFFSFQDLNEDLIRILKVDPKYYGAYAIRGLAMELYRDQKIDSVDELKRAVRVIGKESHTSYLYYRIGHNYEIFWPNLTAEMGYYKLASEVDRNNYRAIYKLAMNQERRNRWEDAIQLWRSILEILECKKDYPSLQPIECAYLYKTYRNLGNLYIKKGDAKKGAGYLKDAISVYKAVKNEKDGFYEWMFGKVPAGDSEDEECWRIYKKAARKKLRVDEVYVDLIKLAAEMNWITEYNQYSGERDLLLGQ